MMNSAYLHVASNHWPIIGIPVALAFLIYSLKKKNEPTRRFSLLVLAILSVIGIIVYFLGEQAEEVVEGLAGFSHEAIEKHEDVGKISLFGLIALTALSVWAYLKDNRKVFYSKATAAVGLILTFLLLYTAYVGGAIRHTEFLN